MSSTNPGQRRWLAVLGRRAVLAWTIALVVLLLVFVVRNEDDFARSIRTVRDADPAWLLAGGVLAALSQVGFTQVLWLLVRRLHPQLRWRTAANAHMHRFGVSAVSPLPGPGIVALTRTLRGPGVSTENSLLAVALEALIGHGSLALYLVPMLAFLAIEGELSPVMLAGSATLFVFLVAIATVIGVALRPGGLPGSLEARIPVPVRAFLEKARAHRVRPGDLVWPLLVALGINVVGAATLYTALAAVDAEPTIAMAATAYGAATLFLLVAPVFSGIGIVEVGAVVTLRQFEVPAEQALSATILYRVAALWLPLIVSLVVPVATNPWLLRRGRAPRA